MKYQVNYKYQYPIRLLYGFLNVDGENHQIPIAFPAKTDWGEIIPDEKFVINTGEDIYIELGWTAIQTYQTYYFRAKLPIPSEVIRSPLFTLIIGLGNLGEISLWLYNDTKNILLLYTHGVNISDKVTDDMISKVHFIDVHGNHIKSLEELCKNDLHLFNDYKRLNTINVNCIENRMKRYSYRYDIKIKQTHENIIVSDFLFDGTFDKISTNELCSYHEAGKVRRLLISWLMRDTEDVDEFTAYFWFNEEEITKIFERFYWAHPEIKADFIIRIDAENKKYELALYRQGLKEPVVIPESAYQLIVFKNKFEDYRSENYNQPRGAWIW